jgi:rabconnectin-3a
MHWSFDRVNPPARLQTQPPLPTISRVVKREGFTSKSHEDNATGKSSPPPARSPVFGIQARRQSFLVIDMEIPSLPATRPASPDPRLSRSIGSSSSVRPVVLPAAQESAETEEIDMAKADVQAKRTGLGNLMQSAKKDVKVAEFDINAFF